MAHPYVRVSGRTTKRATFRRACFLRVSAPVGQTKRPAQTSTEPTTIEIAVADSLRHSPMPPSLLFFLSWITHLRGLLLLSLLFPSLPPTFTFLVIRLIVTPPEVSHFKPKARKRESTMIGCVAYVFHVDVFDGLLMNSRHGFRSFR